MISVTHKTDPGDRAGAFETQSVSRVYQMFQDALCIHFSILTTGHHFKTRKVSMCKGSIAYTLQDSINVSRLTVFPRRPPSDIPGMPCRWRGWLRLGNSRIWNERGKESRFCNQLTAIELGVFCSSHVRARNQRMYGLKGFPPFPDKNPIIMFQTFLCYRCNRNVSAENTGKKSKHIPCLVLIFLLKKICCWYGLILVLPLTCF